MTWQSEPLRLNVEGDCVICRFVKGEDLSKAELLEVIRALDHDLAKAETANRGLMHVLSQRPAGDEVA